jgi:hypothetical protein
MREVLKGLEMCLSEQSRGLGDDTSGDDGTNRPSTEERRQKLEMYLQEESGSNDSEVGISDGNESGSYLREKFELPE